MEYGMGNRTIEFKLYFELMPLKLFGRIIRKF